MTAAARILAEHAAARPLTADDIATFVGNGIPAAALTWTACGELAMLARDRVTFDGQPAGRFEFERYTRGWPAANAFVLPLLGLDGEWRDILAWRPDVALAGLWEGTVAVAGEEQVLSPRLDEALDVHPGVLEWLQAGRQGVVILDALRAAAVLQGTTLRAANPCHARWLRNALARPAPRIVLAKAAAGSRAA